MAKKKVEAVLIRKDIVTALRNAADEAAFLLADMQPNNGSMAARVLITLDQAVKKYDKEMA